MGREREQGMEYLLIWAQRRTFFRAKVRAVVVCPQTALTAVGSVTINSRVVVDCLDSLKTLAKRNRVSIK